jgi:nucleoside-diphosphate-sugar epimerase
MPKLYFITGGTGFIGVELIRHLLSEGHYVNCLYRSESKIAPLKDLDNQGQITFYQGTLADYNQLKAAMKGADGVFHVAALARAWSKGPNDFHEINIQGTLNVLEAAKAQGRVRVVFTSTGGTLATGTIQHPADEATERKVSFYNYYESTKYQNEQDIRDFAANGGDALTVNPTRVYGPGVLSISNAATLLIQKYINGRWRFMLGTGKSQGNFTYVQDVVEGHILAMKYGRAGERYILGGENMDLATYFQKIGEQSGKNYPLYKIPMKAAEGFAHLQKFKANLLKTPPMITPDWVQKYYQNWACISAKAQEELGYKITPADRAIAETIEWIREQR